MTHRAQLFSTMKAAAQARQTQIALAAEISNYSAIYCRCHNVVDAKPIKN